jgi:acyl carrier protein
VGRADFQVKVRGFRVELGEVETVARSAKGVRAAVVAVAGSGVAARLVGYVVPDHTADRDGLAGRVRDVCRARLPEYMVPSGWVVLDELPWTPNGKVDRTRLPVDGVVEGVAAGFVAPESDVERRVAVVWQDLLEAPRVGLADNFFDLGGHSLLVARMVDELRREFGVDIPIRDVFLDATVAAVAASVERALGTTTAGTTGQDGSAGTGGIDDRLLDDLARLPMGEFEAVLAEPAWTTSEER